MDSIVSQVESKHAFSANLSVIKTKDAILGTLLDLMG
jgi:flagellar hook protein FlgE